MTGRLPISASTELVYYGGWHDGVHKGEAMVTQHILVLTLPLKHMPDRGGWLDAGLSVQSSSCPVGGGVVSQCPIGWCPQGGG